MGQVSRSAPREMEKIFNLGVDSYQAAARRTPFTAADYFTLIGSALVDFGKFVVLSLPYWIEAIVYLIVWRPKKSVADQVVLITGAGNGIGRGMALRLAAEQCRIAVVDIDRVAANRTVEEIAKTNGTAVAYCMDITDTDAIENLRKQVQNDLGPVDILINNAAIIPLLSLREGSHNEVRRLVDVNITANFIMTRVFLKEMERRRSGHIVNMSSLSAYYPIPGGILYTASKYAVRGFSEALSEELRQEGLADSIYVTSVHPYFVATRADLMEIVKPRIPAISPKRCANAIVDGILRNQLHVIVPSQFRLIAEIIRLLPYKVQHLVRDYVCREGELAAVARARSDAVFK